MIVSNLKLKNWRNFRNVDVALQPRQFVVGPNASGKSNLLDAFRFLHDIAKQKGGGLQEAVEKRGGTSKLRCLSAGRDSEIVIGVAISEFGGSTNQSVWRYEIGIKGSRGHRQPLISREKVWKGDNLILERPNDEDNSDKERLKQTYLEQVNNNENFRDIQRFFERISYMHLVPQLLRHSKDIQGKVLEDDPFGQGFLENMAGTPVRMRTSKLNRINNIIKIAVPQLSEIKFSLDNYGRPHISALHTHWRPNAGWQTEDQFSDGTLRLIALLWSLMDGDSLLLVEEPELSLHAGIVKKLAPLLYKALQKRKRQLLISTHSTELLSNNGIDGGEVLLLSPTSNKGTIVDIASKLKDVRALLSAGATVGEVVIPRTMHRNPNQSDIFFDL